MATDDSDSMVYAQNGERIKTLQEILNNIADIYGLAKDTGISTVRFLNAAKGKKNVTAKTVKTVIKGHDYGGVTRIGTELRKKILDRFVLGKEMKKPLLVLVITDGAVRSQKYCSFLFFLLHRHELNLQFFVGGGRKSIPFRKRHKKLHSRITKA